MSAHILPTLVESSRMLHGANLLANQVIQSRHPSFKARHAAPGIKTQNRHRY